jgi:hypothetical protein
VPSITYSALALFKKCPQAYTWRYVENRPEPPSDPKARYLGNLLAALVEKFYVEQLWLHGPEAYDILQCALPQVARDVIEKEHYTTLTEAAQSRMDEKAAVLIHEALNTIKQQRLIGVTNFAEHRISVPFEGGWTVRGRADLVFFSKDGWTLVDGKSGTRQADPDQLRLYALGLEADSAIGVLPARMGFWWFQKGVVKWRRVRPTLLVKFRAGVQATLARVAAQEAQPTPSPHCRLCDYRGDCPAGQAWVAEHRPPGSLVELPVNAVGEVSL